jgi:hypothetical protein
MALSPSLRSTLRLSLTVAVVQGFAAITGLADTTYAALAVLSVSVGTYGETFELGRQRLIGTLIGALVLLIAYPALQGLPLVVGLPLALLVIRLIAGGLRLSVGYSVGCMVVVMGWVVHEGQLNSWIPLRLFWTLFGVLMALWSLRLFWPALARRQQQENLIKLLAQLQQAWEHHVQHQIVPLAPLRSALLDLRNQRASALRELGSGAQRHPLARLWQSFDAVLEDQILILGEVQRLPQPPWQDPGFAALGRQLSERQLAVEQRLLTWQQRLRARMVPPLPQPPWEPIDHLAACDEPAMQQAIAGLPETARRHLATRLLLFNRLEQGISSLEVQWRAAIASGRDG